MMYDHFRQLVLMMQFKTYQIFSMFLFKVMTFKISIQDGIKHIQKQMKYLLRLSLKICTR